MKKKRQQIGILLYFDESWMGGIIYILNIIRTLNFLDEEEKPDILLFYRPSSKKFLNEIDYPYLKPIEWQFPSIAKGNLSSIIRNKNLFIDEILKKYKLDAMYPLHNFPVKTNTETKLIHWCADLQYKHYPEFFSRKQIFAKNFRIKRALQNTDNMVVSSQAVLDDFHRFFKLRKEHKTDIYHFVSIIDDFEDLNFEDVKEKYNLPNRYFIISNQFHKHKNHKVALQALAKLKQRGIRLNLVMTGKLPSADNSPYLAELHEIINSNGLSEHIVFLGVIPRKDQLMIMKHSQAVIQPSLFEGWSTVIEDARSLQLPVIAANLNVNIEQLGETGVYFEPHNVDQLVSILIDYPERDMSQNLYEDYSVRVKEAARKLLSILS